MVQAPDKQEGARRAGGARGVRAPDDAPAGVTTDQITRKILPQRYVIRDDEEGRFLTCLEAPNVAVRMTTGATVTSAAARRAAAGTIFLDGAAQDAPFLDAQHRIYNLDHHEGCVRAFTLATCEQAMVLVRKGLDLRGGDWKVVANDPDLDTVLAIWVLFNHMRLNESSELRAAVMPLIRLEGVIDAHGFELKELSGLPSELMAETLMAIDHLRVEELGLKREGRWSSIDSLEYTAWALRAVDELVYSPRDFGELRDVNEVLRLPIGEDRTALVCRSEAGIYEVEEHVKRLHGDRIGLIILEKEAGVYTLRQTDPFLAVSLDEVYDRLNLLDPAVGGDGGNRWGGSADIGGSPRATGSSLSPAEVARICQRAYRPPSLAERAVAVARATGVAVGAVGVAVVVAALAGPGLLPRAVAAGDLGHQIVFAATLVVLAAALLLVPGRSSPRRFGLRRPAGTAWLAWLPLVALSAWLGGAWAPAAARSNALAVALLLGPAASELLFRGVVQGMLLPYFRVQHAGGRVFLSLPAAVSALLSTIATVVVYPLPLWRAGGEPFTFLAPVVWVVAAWVLGAACAMARERGESVLPPLLLHLVGISAVWGLAALL